jgi:signal transduction histidine kinase
MTADDVPTYRTYVGDRLVDSGTPARGPRAAFRRLAPLIAGTVALAFVVLSIAHAWERYDGPAWVKIPLELAGLPFIIGGVVLWSQRRRDYLGPFALALGTAWYAGNLQSFDVEPVFVIGFVCYHLNVVMFAHLAMLVPNGELRSGGEKAVVAALYVTTPGIQLLRYLDVRPEVGDQFGDVTEYDSVWADVGTLVGVTLAVLAVGYVRRHYRRDSSVAQRRSFAVFWVAAVALGVTAVVAAVLEAWRDRTVQQAALAAYAVSFAATGIGLVLGTVNVASSTRGVLRDLGAADADLERAVGAALGDPGLRLYILERGRWTRNGRPVPDPRAAGDPPGASTLINSHAGRPADVLVLHDRVIAYQRPLLAAVTAMTVTAVQRQRLARGRTEAVVDGQHAERRRIRRDLHDEARGALSSLVQRANSIAGRFPESQTRADLLELARIADRLQGRLAQIVDDIYPPELGGGAAAAEPGGGLRHAVDARKRAVRGPGAPAISVDIPYRRWHLRNELTAYYVISEALNNVVRHSGAATARVVVDDDGNRMRIVVTDDGQWRPTDRSDRRGGTGLDNMRTRATSMGGTLEVGEAPEGGTRVEALVPLLPFEEEDP